MDYKVGDIVGFVRKDWSSSIDVCEILEIREKDFNVKIFPNEGDFTCCNETLDINFFEKKTFFNKAFKYRIGQIIGSESKKKFEILNYAVVNDIVDGDRAPVWGNYKLAYKLGVGTTIYEDSLSSDNVFENEEMWAQKNVKKTPYKFKKICVPVFSKWLNDYVILRNKRPRVYKDGKWINMYRVRFIDGEANANFFDLPEDDLLETKPNKNEEKAVNVEKYTIYTDEDSSTAIVELLYDGNLYACENDLIKQGYVIMEIFHAINHTFLRAVKL